MNTQNKPLLVFYGPVDCYAGYGARSRDIVKALIKSDKYEVKIISCNWGQTPHDFLDPNNEEHKQILDCIIPNMLRQPDIWVMNTIPPEMQKVGKYNILITAGIETTLVDPSWIEGCNRADLVLVSSEHAKKIFQDSSYEKRNNQTQHLSQRIALPTLSHQIDMQLDRKPNQIHRQNPRAGQ